MLGRLWAAPVCGFLHPVLCFIRDITVGGGWVKGTRGFPALFFAMPDALVTVSKLSSFLKNYTQGSPLFPLGTALIDGDIEWMMDKFMSGRCHVRAFIQLQKTKQTPKNQLTIENLP